MKKRIISVMAVSAVLLLNGAVTAAADETTASQDNTSISAGAGLEPEIITFDYDTDRHEGTVYTYDECVAIIFAKSWGKKYDDGVSFPQQSLTYHKIRTFLDEYYLSDEGLHAEWDKYFDILNKWSWYCQKTAQPNTRGKDDGEGHYSIVDTETGETVYTFELVDNMWQKLDKDGNVVDTFAAHPVGDKSEYDGIIGNESGGEQSGNDDSEDEILTEQQTESTSETAAAVTGVIREEHEKSEITTTTTAAEIQGEEPAEPAAEDKADEKEKGYDNKSALKIIGAVIVAVIAAVGAMITNKKKRKK